MECNGRTLAQQADCRYSLSPTDICFSLFILVALLVLPVTGFATSVTATSGPLVSALEQDDAEKQDAEKQDAEKQDAEKQDAEKQDAEKQDAEKQDDPDDALRRRIEEANRKIQEAIEAGEITEEQGRERLEQLRKRVAGRQVEGESKDDPRKNEALVARYLELEKKLKVQVEAGRMTAEEAEKQLLEARASMFGQPKKDDAGKKAASDEAIRGRVEEAKRKIQEAVEAGEITEEQGSERLAQLRKRVASRQVPGESREADKEQAADEGIQRRLAEAGRKIRESIAAGEITAEQGRARYEALRKRLISSRERAAKGAAEDKGNADDAVAKVERQLREAGTKLRKEIADGKMTREEAKVRFDELRKQLTDAKEKARAEDKKKTPSADDKKAPRRTFTRQQYMEAETKMKKMVEEGKISVEQMEKRLVEMRKNLED